MKKTTYRTALSSIAMKACLLFAAAMLLASSAKADCGQWDLSGSWYILIPKGPATTLDVRSGTGTLSGTGRLNPTSSSAFSPIFDGKLTGQVKGNEVSISIFWYREKDPYGVGEDFQGTIGSDGVIKGTGYVPALGGSVPVTWSSSRPMKCLNEYKALHHMREVHHGNAAGPVPPAPVPLQAPGIVASPNNIALPAGQASGTTTLTWDGGKDHPYAEIWVKVDDQDETKVLEQGKGTLQVTVVPGKTYLYILTDAGVTLATVTVKFNR